MHQNFTQLYLHCVWGTWDRLPLITPDIETVIWAAIARQCQQLNCKVLAVGGVADHVHLLTAFPPDLSVSNLIGQAKGSSSHLVTHEIACDRFFKWQGGYGAFTVNRQDLPRIVDYIKNQATHHQQKSTIESWEVN
jgi:putative transposase